MCLSLMYIFLFGFCLSDDGNIIKLMCKYKKQIMYILFKNSSKHLSPTNIYFNWFFPSFLYMLIAQMPFASALTQEFLSCVYHVSVFVWLGKTNHVVICIMFTNVITLRCLPSRSFLNFLVLYLVKKFWLGIFCVTFEFE